MLEQNQKGKNYHTCLFTLIPFGIIFTMFFAWQNINCYSPDSYRYIKLADDLPKLYDSVFPFLFPFLLKITNYFLEDYHSTFKLINLFSVIFILAFVKIKNFYWKEIWVLMTFSSLQNIFPRALPENLLFSLLIVFCYVNHEFLNKKLSPKKFVFFATFLLTAMFLLKYNSIFIVFSCFLFAFIIKDKMILTNYFLTSVISAIIFISYLALNFYYTGHFTGIRGTSASFNFSEFVVGSFRNIPLAYDPFAFSLRRIAVAAKIYFGLTYVTIVPYVLSYMLSIFAVIYFAKRKQKVYDTFTFLCIVIAVVFLICSLFVGSLTKIDTLDFRLLLVFYVFVCIGAFHWMRVNFINYDHILLFIGIASIVVFCFSLSIQKTLASESNYQLLY